MKTQQHKISPAGIMVKTGLKGGAEGCEKILGQMDKLIKDMKDLRGQMGQMAKMMSQK